MLPPTTAERTAILELKIGDDSHWQNADKHKSSHELFLIKCIGTTLVVSKKHFKDIFKLLKKGDTFKAVVEKVDDAGQHHFKYFLRIDRPLF